MHTPSPFHLHRLVAAGDTSGVRALLDGDAAAAAALEVEDPGGATPLVRAIWSPAADADLVRLLLERGASLDRWCTASRELRHPPLVHALRAGDPAKIRTLLDAGAGLAWRDENGYDAMLHAVGGACVATDPRLLDRLRLLVERGAPLDGRSAFGESSLSVLSFAARYDGVRLLLEAGADATPLQWTVLHRAAAIGTPADVEAAVAAGTPLDARDRLERSAWHVALLAGALGSARRLRELGASTGARDAVAPPWLGVGGASARERVLRALLEDGMPPDLEDALGRVPLEGAVETDDVPCAELLLAAGADVRRVPSGGLSSPWGLLWEARSRRMVELLLRAGAPPKDLSDPGRRAMLGLSPDPDETALHVVTAAEFSRARTRRFGRSNPEPTDEPFWLAMVRSGVSAYDARVRFEGGDLSEPGPVWCARRFGASLSVLPDGRMVVIGGEHEDAYDPDFCIYNDVLVREPDGTLRLFAYPQDAFPPTDRHAATVVDGSIVVVGNLGYPAQRRPQETPVYRLDTTTFRFDRIPTTGEGPGWIFDHRADLVAPHLLRVSEGTVVRTPPGDEHGTEVHEANVRSYLLDLRDGRWRAE